MKRYAFIDVSNTIGTTIELLNFKIDWEKLILHLKGEKWLCNKVLYYRGNKGRKKDEKDKLKLENIGYIVNTKVTYKYKDRTKTYLYKCEHCGKDGSFDVFLPGQRKSNCDVDLTVDAMEMIEPGSEYLIFTGDGDFAYLIEKLIQKGVKVRIVSNTGIDKKGKKTFSSRLADIIKREESGQKRVSFIDINDWKVKIEKLNK